MCRRCWRYCGSGPPAAGVAALALGDLYKQVTTGKPQDSTGQAIAAALAAAFFDIQQDHANLWATTYALALLDVVTVQRVIVTPFLGRGRE